MAKKDIYEKGFSVDVSYTTLNIDTVLEELELLEKVERIVEAGKVPKLNKDDQMRLARLVRNSSYIYFVSALDGQLVKIGKSGCVRTRYMALNTQSPVPLTLVSSFRCHEEMEFVLHKVFKKHRSHGEWFRKNDLLDSLMESAKKGPTEAISLIKDHVVDISTTFR